jgi:hypothetical protein
MHTIINFRNRNTDEILRQLILVNTSRMIDSIKNTLVELTEKYCLPEQEILVETNNI